MKSITTKYHGATNFKPSKFTATDGDNRVTVSYDHELDADGNHRAAAIALCKKLDWHGKLAQGSTKQGCVFVFVDVQSTFKV